MKKLILTIAAATVMTMASAMSYSQARDQALFLTDKMAYELNLSYDQYNAAYEINLDYIMNIEMAGDLFGIYWNRRNSELSYVLTAAQYRVFTGTSYFYRPIEWSSNKFRFVIYDRYEKNRYYRAAPPGYQTYKGANRYYDNSAYKGRVFTGAGSNGSTVNRAAPGASIENRPVAGGSGRRPGGTGTMNKKQAVNQGKQDMQNRRR